jgi:hypothetical protein
LVDHAWICTGDIINIKNLHEKKSGGENKSTRNKYMRLDKGQTINNIIVVTMLGSYNINMSLLELQVTTRVSALVRACIYVCIGNFKFVPVHAQTRITANINAIATSPQDNPRHMLHLVRDVCHKWINVIKADLSNNGRCE